MTSRTALLLLLAVLSAAGLVIAQDKDPGGIKVSPWVQLAGFVSPDEDVALRYSIALTEPYLRIQDPSQVVRMLSVSTAVTVGQIMLKRESLLKGVDVESADPIEIDLSVNVADVELFAGAILGIAVEPSDPEYRSYDMVITPAGAKSWGDVSSKADLVVTASAR